MSLVRILLAVASWGGTAVMMHPSFASLIVLACNAAILAALAYPKRIDHA